MLLRLAVFATVALFGAGVASDVLLESFETGAPMHTWVEKNDPVMGGKSTGTFTSSGSAAVFDGEVVDVPFLKAPGFIKVSTNMNEKYPDVSSCEGIAITAMSSNAYNGFRFSFGTAHAPGGGFFAYGYKQTFFPTVGTFGTVVLPFYNFTDAWNDGTGDPVHTCQSNKVYCPTPAALADLQTMSLWGEGVGGKVHLEVRKITAVGCN